MQHHVAVFSEDDFDSLHSFVTHEEANGFARGAKHVAALYAITVGAYVLPEDEAEMIEKEHVGEVMRVHESISAHAEGVTVDLLAPDQVVSERGQ